MRSHDVFLTQRGDDVSQSHQRLVDVPSLFQTNARRSGGVGSLAAGEVHQVDLTDRLARHLRVKLGLKEKQRRFEEKIPESAL